MGQVQVRLDIRKASKGWHMGAVADPLEGAAWRATRRGREGCNEPSLTLFVSELEKSSK